ncbi:MAG: hypothetical protein KIG16_02525 [Eubacteriales bacterium]|nr:hypothetical protein [Eubacteriales bacterium]
MRITYNYNHGDKKPLPALTSDRLVSYIFKSLIFRFSKHPELKDKTQPSATRHAKKAELANLKKQLADLSKIKKTYHKQK